MIVRQLFDPASSTYTYLLAEGTGSEAIIIDPVLDRVDLYLRLLDELDLRLIKAVDTHVHADHITALGALRDRTRCITVMGAESRVDCVSMRVSDGDPIAVEGISLTALHTPGHTDDSYCFLAEGRVFTGDTLLIRGTGRTDFQNGDAHAQYRSLFDKLLTLPDETLVYPGHDYKGETVSTIGEERRFNPRLQVAGEDDYVALMNGLKLDNPRMMDVAVPANLRIGLDQGALRGRGWSLTEGEARELLDRPGVMLIDLRDASERRRDGAIPGSLHIPYPDLARHLQPGGRLQALAGDGNAAPIFYCAFGERSAMAVQAARDAGLASARHIEGGFDAWVRAGGAIAPVDQGDAAGPR